MADTTQKTAITIRTRVTSRVSLTIGSQGFSQDAIPAKVLDESAVMRAFGHWCWSPFEIAGSILTSVFVHLISDFGRGSVGFDGGMQAALKIVVRIFLGKQAITLGAFWSQETVGS